MEVESRKQGSNNDTVKYEVKEPDVVILCQDLQKNQLQLVALDRRLKQNDSKIFMAKDQEYEWHTSMYNTIASPNSQPHVGDIKSRAYYPHHIRAVRYRPCHNACNVCIRQHRYTLHCRSCIVTDSVQVTFKQFLSKAWGYTIPPSDMSFIYSALESYNSVACCN